MDSPLHRDNQEVASWISLVLLVVWVAMAAWGLYGFPGLCR